MKSLQWRLAALATLLLLMAALGFSLLVLRDFSARLEPQVEAVDGEIGNTVARVLNKALDHGVPFDRLVGAEAYLDSVRADNPKLHYLAISTPDGRLLYHSYAAGLAERGELEAGLAGWRQGAGSGAIGPYLNSALPLMAQGRQIGWLHIGQLADVARQQLRDIMLDVLTVLVVAALVALEMMRLLMTLAVGTPVALLRELMARIRRRDFQAVLPPDRLGGVGRLNRPLNRLVQELNRRARGLGAAAAEAGQFHGDKPAQVLAVEALDYIRWPFFLLIFADSLSLSFLPVYAGHFYQAGLGLSPQLVSSLPISLFMLIWALTMPWAGQWCDRFGYRRAFASGAAITTAGLLLTAAAQHFYGLLLWRAVTALGYGTVFVTAQSYIANNTPAKQRTRGMAVFLSTFFAGSLSGAAIGGILVDRLGERPTFVLSALLSIAAAGFVLRFIRPGHAAQIRKPLQLADLAGLLRHRQFSAITFLTAIPSKIALTGFLYYAVPLYLKSVGATQSSTGRMMMAYGLAIILLSPHVARLADVFGHRRWFVIAGGYAAALGMFVTWFNDSPFGVLLSISLLGVAHAIGVSPQLALVGDCCEDAVERVGLATTTGMFRLLERLGNVFGPLLAAVLIASYGFKGAFYGVGALILVTTTLFVAVGRRAAVKVGAGESV
jgi:MFS family permease/HAMP domain-containing protein